MSGMRSGIVAGGADVAAAGIVAHVAGGGSAGPAAAVVFAVATAVGGLGGSRVRWTFGRALAAAALAQPVVHLALAGGPGGHAGHAGHGMATTGGMPGGTADRMWVLHTVVAVGVAVLVRWGGRWLRTMPSVVRAVVEALVPAGAPAPRSATTWCVSTEPALCGAAASLAWTSRGPPAVA